LAQDPLRAAHQQDLSVHCLYLFHIRPFLLRLLQGHRMALLDRLVVRKEASREYLMSSAPGRGEEARNLAAGFEPDPRILHLQNEPKEREATKELMMASVL
jgi:hypothetical protein